MVLTGEKFILDNVNLDKKVEQWQVVEGEKLTPDLWTTYVLMHSLNFKLTVFMLDLPNLRNLETLA